jgi:hypothetical protein
MSMRGPQIAQSVRALVDRHLDENPTATLTDLVAQVEHIDARAGEWREAAVSLAADVRAVLRTSDASKTYDAVFALHQVAQQIDWARERGLIGGAS